MELFDSDFHLASVSSVSISDASRFVKMGPKAFMEIGC